MDYTVNLSEIDYIPSKPVKKRLSRVSDTFTVDGVPFDPQG